MQILRACVCVCVCVLVALLSVVCFVLLLCELFELWACVAVACLPCELWIGFFRGARLCSAEISIFVGLVRVLVVGMGVHWLSCVMWRGLIIDLAVD